MAVLLKVKGGLGNRLRAVSSMHSWTQARGEGFAIAWPVTPAFGAALDELYVHSFRQVPSRLAAVVARITGGYRTEADSSSRLQVVQSGAIQPHVEHPYDTLRELTPVAHLMSRIQRISEDWTQPMVGVMIRAHERSHALTRSTSPPEAFYSRMAEIKLARPDVRFFLSTDSPSVSAEVHARFEDVIEQPKTAAYNSREAIRDSVCDLHLLAKTSHILGSHWSSFSEIAHELSGHDHYEVPLEWER